MILSRRIALNGQYLDELHERIVIRSISFGEISNTISTTSRMGGFGQRITGDHADTMDVVLSFAINVRNDDMITRRQIYEDACKWAQQCGWMTVNFLPDRRLWVDRALIQGAGDMRDWSGEYSITFRAYSVPFWQDVLPVSVTKTSYSSGSFTLPVPGQFQTVAEVEFKNTSGSAVTSFSITAGGSTIALTGISIANNATLKIYHENNGILRIKNGSTSVYDKRTAASADDLYVNPGNVTVTLSAGGAGTVKVSVCGRYA